MAQWRHAVGRLACAASTLCLAGCATYLHDPDLQKSTAGALATYKSADLNGAMTAAIEQQKKLDEAEVQGMAEAEATDRERAVADLLWPTADPADGVSRLKTRIEARLLTLGVPLSSMASLNGLGERMRNLKARDLVGDAQIKVYINAYNAAGHVNITDCPAASATLTGSDPPEVRNLWRQCEARTVRAEQAKLHQAILDDLAAAGGEIGGVEKQLSYVSSELATVESDKKAATKKLQDEKDRLKALGDPPMVDKQVEDALAAINKTVGEVDDAAGLAGKHALKLGDALALVEFRKANLQDALKPVKADDGSPSASARRAVAGVIAGIIELNQARDDAPTAASLSIGLVAQQGLQNALQLQVDGLKAQKALLERQRTSLLSEAEMLSTAWAATDDALQKASALPKTPPMPCTARGLRETMIADKCPPEIRQQVSRGLAAYNIAWASGGAPARLAALRRTHQVAMTNLLVSQAALRTRVDVQTTALNTLAAYGEGGITPETIAAFLQSLGVVGIAVGEN